jgi:hypothetical protein
MLLFQQPLFPLSKHKYKRRNPEYDFFLGKENLKQISIKNT